MLCDRLLGKWPALKTSLFNQCIPSVGSRMSFTGWSLVLGFPRGRRVSLLSTLPLLVLGSQDPLSRGSCGACRGACPAPSARDLSGELCGL